MRTNLPPKYSGVHGHLFRRPDVLFCTILQKVVTESVFAVDVWAESLT